MNMSRLFGKASLGIDWCSRSFNRYDAKFEKAMLEFTISSDLASTRLFETPYGTSIAPGTAIIAKDSMRMTMHRLHGVGPVD